MTAGVSRGGRTRRGGRTGRWVELRAPLEHDLPWLQALVTDGGVLGRFRWRGHTPSTSEFVEGLWTAALANFVVVRRADGSAVGLVSAFGANHACTRAQLAVVLDVDHRGRLWPLECLPLMIDYCFETWPLHKLYAETLDGELEAQAGIYRRWLEPEVVLPHHQYVDGHYEALHVHSLSRETWSSRRPLGR